MELVWTPSAVAWVLAWGLAWTAAAFVYFARPDRPQNRWLALLLAAEGLSGLQAGLGAAFVSPAYAYAANVVALQFAYVVFVPVYLLFLGTLEAPLARPFRVPFVRRALVGAVVAGPFAFPLVKDFLIVGVRPSPPGVAVWMPEAGAGMSVMTGVFSVVYLYALAVTWSAWRSSPVGSARRNRAKAYATAFVIYDVSFVTTNVFITVLGEEAFLFPGVVRYVFSATAVVVAAWVLLLAYGILRTQLFDIDLKVKVGLRRGTVAAIFLAVFFVVSEGAAQLLGGWTGSPAVGIVAAGLLVFAIAPIQRAAERVADTAMPSVKASTEYVAFRKLEVYKAAVESALEEGDIEEKERAILNRQREKLGISAEDAVAVERDVRERFSVAS